MYVLNSLTIFFWRGSVLLCHWGVPVGKRLVFQTPTFDGVCCLARPSTLNSKKASGIRRDHRCFRATHRPKVAEYSRTTIAVAVDDVVRGRKARIMFFMAFHWGGFCLVLVVPIESGPEERYDGNDGRQRATGPRVLTSMKCKTSGMVGVCEGGSG
jgi:hypothetical protein